MNKSQIYQRMKKMMFWTLKDHVPLIVDHEKDRERSVDTKTFKYFFIYYMVIFMTIYF